MITLNVYGFLVLRICQRHKAVASLTPRIVYYYNSNFNKNKRQMVLSLTEIDSGPCWLQRIQIKTRKANITCVGRTLSVSDRTLKRDNTNNPKWIERVLGKSGTIKVFSVKDFRCCFIFIYTPILYIIHVSLTDCR